MFTRPIKSGGKHEALDDGISAVVNKSVTSKLRGIRCFVRAYARLYVRWRGEAQWVVCQAPHPKCTPNPVIKGSHAADSQHSCREQKGWINGRLLACLFLSATSGERDRTGLFFLSFPRSSFSAVRGSVRRPEACGQFISINLRGMRVGRIINCVELCLNNWLDSTLLTNCTHSDYRLWSRRELPRDW